MAIAGASMVVLLVVVYTTVIAPARSRESAAQAQLQGVQLAMAADRTQLTHLDALAAAQPAQLREAFHLAKAIPVGDQTPGVMLELQRLATDADVQFSQFRTISTTPVNNLTATAYEVNVVGRFFDVDDFMYRVHRQVMVSQRGQLTISGRLFALTGVQLALAGSSTAATKAGAASSVQATLQLMAFSENPATAASTATSTGSAGTASSTASTGATGSTAPTSTTPTTPTSSGGLG
jgi:hypothetical protein